MSKKKTKKQIVWEWLSTRQPEFYIIMFNVLVIASLLALSLSSLKDGYKIKSGHDDWACWAMAVGIDLGIVSAELSWIFAATKKIKWVLPAAITAFCIFIGFSGWMNVESNVANLTLTKEWYLSADFWKAFVLGIFTPVAVALICKYTAGLTIHTTSLKKPKPKRVVKKKVSTLKPKMSNKERKISESIYATPVENEQTDYFEDASKEMLKKHRVVNTMGQKGMDVEEISEQVKEPVELVQAYLSMPEEQVMGYARNPSVYEYNK